MDRAIRAGVSGILVATIIDIFSLLTAVNLYFFPELAASIIVIYLFGLREIKDGLVAAFITYIFTVWIVVSLALAAFFASGETSVTVTIDIWAVLTQVVDAPTALIAGFVGSMLARTKPTTEPTPPPPPPIQPV